MTLVPVSFWVFGRSDKLQRNDTCGALKGDFFPASRSREVLLVERGWERKMGDVLTPNVNMSLSVQSSKMQVISVHILR